MRPQIVIYATIIAMAALAVYDDDSPDDLQFTDAAYMSLVILGPLLALSIAHFFADLADEQIALGRPPSGAEVRGMAWLSLQYTYVALPGILIIAGSYLLSLSVDDAVGFLYIAGILSLFGWGLVVSLRSHARGWVRLALIIGYGLVGVAIVLVENALQPH